MGCSVLYHLATSGVEGAVLLERNRLTSGTSWHSAALVRALRPTQNLTRLAQYSQQLYQRLEQETGQATGWIGKGALSIATTPDRVMHLRRLENLSHLFGIQAEYINPAEAKERWPLMVADDVLGAVWSPEDGRVGVSDLAAALTKGARTAGAKIFENTAVDGLLIRNGRIAGVRSEHGEILCDKVVVCCGLWGRGFLLPHGTHLPLWSCEHFYLLTKPFTGLHGNIPTLMDFDSHLYLRDDSGGMLVGSFEPNARAVDPARFGRDFAFQLLPEDWEHFEPMMEAAMRRVPALETAEVKTLLNGPESFTTDGVFVLGETAETRGLYVGGGFNSIGVASAGGAGYALAHEITHGHPPFALPELDPKRFPDCFNSAEALAARAPEILGHAFEIPYPGWQPHSARNLRLPPLHARWQQHGAVFGQHYGWERPLYFAGDDSALSEPKLTFGRPAWFDAVGAEVMRAHHHAALFELSLLGKIAVEGRDAAAFLQRVCANNMQKPAGSVIYTTMLNERGTIESDLTAHRLGEESYFLYVDADAIRRDMAWLQQHRRDGEQVTLRDESEEWAVIGLFGAKSAEVAAAAGARALGGLRYFAHTQTRMGGCEVRAARLSFVGEAGWELTCRRADATAVFDALAAAGADVAGAYALASMRMEKRFLAYGHDLDADITPLDAGLEFAVAWGSGFVGEAALQAQKQAGAAYQFLTVLLDNPDATVWGNETIAYDGALIGRATSAGYGYRIGKPLAIAQIDLQRIAPLAAGKALPVSVRIGGTHEPATATTAPAYDPTATRMR